MIHVVYDLTRCATANPDTRELLAAMHQTVQLLGCTVLGELPVPFQPHGATVVLVLAESHLVVSTWPEDELAHVDLFTCRADVEPDGAIAPIIRCFGGPAVRSTWIDRRQPSQLPETLNVTITEPI